MKPIHFWIFWTLLVTGTIAFAQSLEEQFQSADAELNRVYKELRSQLNDEQKAELKKSQLAWIKEKDRMAKQARGEKEKLNILKSATIERTKSLLNFKQPDKRQSSFGTRMEEIALGADPNECLIVFYKPGERSSADNVAPVIQSENYITKSLSSVTGALVHAYTKPNDSSVYLFDAKSKAYLGKVNLDDFPDAGELAHGNPPWGLILSTDESLLLCQKFAARGGLVTVLVDTRSLDSTRISGRQFLPLIMADDSGYCLVERPWDEGLSAYEWDDDEPEIERVFARFKQVGSSIPWNSLNVLKIGESLMDGLQLMSRQGSRELSSGTFFAQSKDNIETSYIEQLDILADRYLREKNSALSITTGSDKPHSQSGIFLEYASEANGVFELYLRQTKPNSELKRFKLNFVPEIFQLYAQDYSQKPQIIAEDFTDYWPSANDFKLKSSFLQNTSAKRFDLKIEGKDLNFSWPLSNENPRDTFFDGMIHTLKYNKLIVYRTALSTRLGIFPSLGIFNLQSGKWIAATDGAGVATFDLGLPLIYGNQYKTLKESGFYVSAETDYLGYGSLFSFDSRNETVWLSTRHSLDTQSPEFGSAKLVCLDADNGAVVDEILNTPMWRVFSVGPTRLISSDDPSAGMAQLWNRKPLKKVGDFALRNDVLVFVCTDGFYASNFATKSNLAFKIENRGYPFEQFDLRLNRPDIVLERLGAPDEAIAIAKQLREKRLKRMGVTEDMLQPDFHLPEIEIVGDLPSSTAESELALKIKASDSKYPLDRLRLYVNNVPVNGKEGELLRDAKSQSLERTLPIKLAAGRNKIQVSVLNSAGAESLYANAEVTCTAQRPKPTLYAVAMGVSEYANPEWNLKYAAKDARDILERVNARSGSSYGEIKELLLTDREVTKESLGKIREFLSKATVDDTVLLFVAGHGLLDSKYDYYFGTSDIDFDNPSGNGIAFEEFDDLLADLPCLRKSLLIDTCHAGELDEDEKKMLASAQANPSQVVAMLPTGARGMTIKPIEGARGKSEWYDRLQGLFVDLRRGSGSTILSSSAGAEYALESSEQKNGLFTYAVLEALDGKEGSDANKDGSVTMSELADYVKTRVAALTNNKQSPNVRRVNLEGDFALSKN